MSYFWVLFLAISVSVSGICYPSVAANVGASSPLDSDYLSPLSTEAVNDASLVTTIGPKTRGAAVLRAQILLGLANFGPGEIDAVYGSTMRSAVVGYQASKGLDANGTIDANTWATLNRDAVPALVSYRITAEDVTGPFVPIPHDIMEQAKLPALGYTSPAEALGEKFHASPALLQQLNPGQDFATAGQNIVVPNICLPVLLPEVAKVVVDRSDSVVMLVDAAGKIIAQFPATTGSKHDPLPIGTWKILGIAKKPVFRYNPALFWDAKSVKKKATIAAGPNNPVGVVWIDLSKEHYGIHGTPEPSKISKTQSHGCIRLTNWNALALAEAVSPGMPAILQE
ncbi:murein L,D-transpeptidase [Desulfopila sp. IMCC35006]|uniref:L,D-transpeptidase family protein n=1 Tax=Desulfopila sp. IMCC35006 TaxID=2569542 RepID=UPI0010AD76D2|nr:L,D-transpeptidase [Desulfopila sp. IMCC35006]TKB28423.1 murein L,D-transpeptidase [Desulfopila sp. IMCC35006]